MARQSVAQARKQALKASAGIVTEPETDKAPAFTSVTSKALGPFKSGDTLSTKQHHVAFYRLLLNEFTETETKLTDNQVWQGIQTVSLEGLDTPQEIDEARLAYLVEIKTTMDEPLDDKTKRDIESESEMAAHVTEMGKRADKKLEQVVVTSLDGKLAWDGGPLTIEAELVRIYGQKELDTLPMIGTVQTGQTHKKTGVSKDNMPVGYNGYADKIRVTLKGKDEPEIVTLSRYFIEAMPHVARLQTERKTVNSILNGDTLAMIPSKYAPYCPPKASLNNAVMEGFKADLATQVTRNVNRITQALAYYQVKRMIDEHLPDVRYALVDGTAEATAKRTRPIQMFSPQPSLLNPSQLVPSPSGRPIPLSQFIRFGKFIHATKEAHGSGPQLAKLLELSKAKKGAKAKAPATVVENAITNVDGFRTVLSNVFTYVETHDSSIKAALLDKRHSGETAYWMVTTYNTLSNHINKDVITLAQAYDKEMLAGTAERAKAEADAKEAAMKAAAANQPKVKAA